MVAINTWRAHYTGNSQTGRALDPASVTVTDEDGFSYRMRDGKVEKEDWRGQFDDPTTSFHANGFEDTDGSIAAKLKSANEKARETGQNKGADRADDHGNAAGDLDSAAKNTPTAKLSSLNSWKADCSNGTINPQSAVVTANNGVEYTLRDGKLLKVNDKNQWVDVDPLSHEGAAAKKAVLQAQDAAGHLTQEIGYETKTMNGDLEPPVQVDSRAESNNIPTRAFGHHYGAIRNHYLTHYRHPNHGKHHLHIRHHQGAAKNGAALKSTPAGP